MELIDRIGGLGKIRLTPAEDHKIGALWEIIANNGQKCFLRENCEHAPAYDILMSELFPAYQDKTGGVPRRVHLQADSHFYQGIGGYVEIRIPNKLPLSRMLGHYDVNLSVIKPYAQSIPEFFASVTLESVYTPDCVDDLVQRLGAREKPTITQVQLMPVPPTYSSTSYGIADVPRLGTVIELYRKATALVAKSPEITGATSKQLNILRRDAKEHENLAVRELSQHKYDNYLKNLLILGS